MTPPDCPAPVHNTRAAYRAGCTHPEARQAHLAYVQAWRRTPAGRALRQREYAARRLSHPSNFAIAQTRRVNLAVAMHERGASLREIADQVERSTRTVERYISRGA
jgi:DNA-binding NarL/FixJ family response regulator